MDEINFSQLFHQASKDIGKGHPANPKDFDEWPDEWKTTYYKSYPRLKNILLGNKTPHADLFSSIQARRSERDFIEKPINLDEISIILKYSCGNTFKISDGRSSRAYPSGGRRYPLETYYLNFITSKNLEPGLYHYNVKDHLLDVLWERDFTSKDIETLFTYEWVQKTAGAIVITAIFWKNQNKYGERGYRQILQESGHIGQNIYLVSQALGLKCCALSGTHDEALEKLLDIDGVTESVVYAVAIGK